MNDGIPIPRTADPRKMDPKELWDQLQEERRDKQRLVAEEKQRSRVELDRFRESTAQHNRDLQNQNSTLLRSMTRLQLENDRLTQEVTMLRVRLENGGYREEAPPPAAVQGRPVVTPVMEPPMPTAAIPIVPPAAPALGGEAIPKPIKPQPQPEG